MLDDDSFTEDNLRFWDENASRNQYNLGLLCQECATPYDSIAVHVQQNTITEVTVFERGALDDARQLDGFLPDVIEVRDSKLIGRSDWLDAGAFIRLP